MRAGDQSRPSLQKGAREGDLLRRSFGSRRARGAAENAGKSAAHQSGGITATKDQFRALYFAPTL
jgi:hypothetical protein